MSASARSQMEILNSFLINRYQVVLIHRQQSHQETVEIVCAVEILREIHIRKIDARLAEISQEINHLTIVEALLLKLVLVAFSLFLLVCVGSN